MRYALSCFQLGKPKQALWAMLPAVALALTVPGRSIADRAVPISYTLTLVAKTGDTIGGKTLTGFKLPSFGPNAPAINASGSVAFYATYSQGDFVGEGIFTPTSLGIKDRRHRRWPDRGRNQFCSCVERSRYCGSALPIVFSVVSHSYLNDPSGQDW